MDEFYLIVLARKVSDKGSKLSRVAKCSFDHYVIIDGKQIGEWWAVLIYDSPIELVSNMVCIPRDWDAKLTAARVLDELFAAGLNRQSAVKWEADCGPIDAEDAALLRIELAIV
jgi:hypothetical protein